MTMASGLYVANMIDVFDATQLAIDLSLTTHKVILVTNTYTPNFSTHVAYSDVTNELTTAGGYTQDSKTLSGLAPTLTESPSGTMMYDLTTDVSWTSASFTARGSVLYADALATNNLIVAQTFGADYTATNGTFTIQLAATGWFTVDWTP